MLDFIINFIISFFTAVPPLELLFIFSFKIMQVTVGTLRIILISKGFRKHGTIFSFFEVFLWVFVASQVIIGLTEAPIKGIVYSIAFTIGVYVGSRIENHIGMGQVLIQAIVPMENAFTLAEAMRERGYAVTTIEAQGRDSQKMVLWIFANRKGCKKISEEIHNLDNTAMIITNDISALRGGMIGNAGKRSIIPIP